MTVQLLTPYADPGCHNAQHHSQTDERTDDSIDYSMDDNIVPVIANNILRSGTIGLIKKCNPESKNNDHK